MWCLLPQTNTISVSRGANRQELPRPYTIRNVHVVDVPYRMALIWVGILLVVCSAVGARHANGHFKATI